MTEFFHTVFSPPVLLATTLLLLITFYWLLMIIGMLDLDLFDFDLDLDLDADLDVGTGGGSGHGSVLEIGVVSLKALNLGDVPLMVWLTPFALCFWLLAMILDRELTDPTVWKLLATHTRNFVISVVAAKIVTQPLKGKFETPEPLQSKDLLGKDVMIISLQADETFGQAEFPTGAAPLRLNVRTDTGTVVRGELARIIDFDPHSNTYIVQSINRET